MPTSLFLSKAVFGIPGLQDKLADLSVSPTVSGLNAIDAEGNLPHRNVVGTLVNGSTLATHMTCQRLLRVVNDECKRRAVEELESRNSIVPCTFFVKGMKPLAPDVDYRDLSAECGISEDYLHMMARPQSKVFRVKREVALAVAQGLVNLSAEFRLRFEQAADAVTDEWDRKCKVQALPESIYW